MSDSTQPTPVTLAELEEWASKNGMKVFRGMDGYFVKCISYNPELNPPAYVVEYYQEKEYLSPIIHVETQWGEVPDSDLEEVLKDLEAQNSNPLKSRNN